ncbi:MAG: ABC transporter substrate-binding protein, partial [Chloroflexi bacterium]|nr:ABC transporter substrate-binding protein [Chloroflexota bacterium]
MNRRDRAIVAVLAIVLIVIGGALALPRNADAPEPDARPEITMPPPVVYREGVVGTAESITPVTARSRAERSLVGLVFSGLVRLGPGTSYQPDLADSWSTDAEGRTWTFKLRDDAVWHDGEPVTAEDVVFTVDVRKSPDAAGATA